MRLFLRVELFSYFLSLLFNSVPGEANIRGESVMWLFMVCLE